MQTPFLGEIIFAAYNYPPRGWHVCDGTLLPINQYAALYSLIGTTYGGNGQTNFALPDLRGRVPVGFGDGPGLTPVPMGESAGSEQVSLNEQQIPAHDHEVAAAASGGKGATQDPAGAVYAGLTDTKIWAGVPATAENMNSGMVKPAGGGQSHENRMPYLAMNYLIALQGLFPQRP
jgi:microcystin-dependent protein